MVRSFRGLCLICFCILGLALVVAILEVAALPVMLNATGCQSNFEILPNFTCGPGLIRRSIEVVLNLPLIFVYAPAFTLFVAHTPARNFMLLLYLFDVILIFALTYPLLLYFRRKHTKHSG
ncbi:hypothetical protein V1289_009428 [Bradyrhizobium sp. AZCC 2289]